MKRAIVRVHGAMLARAGGGGQQPRLVTLDRKRRVLELMERGLSGRAIGRMTGIRLETVQRFVRELGDELMQTVRDFDSRLYLGALLERNAARRLRLHDALDRLDEDSPRFAAIARELTELDAREGELLRRLGLLDGAAGGASEDVDFGAYADWSDERLREEQAFRIRAVWLRLDPIGFDQAMRAAGYVPVGEVTEAVAAAGRKRRQRLAAKAGEPPPVEWTPAPEGKRWRQRARGRPEPVPASAEEEANSRKRPR